MYVYTSLRTCLSISLVTGKGLPDCLFHLSSHPLVRHCVVFNVLQSRGSGRGSLGTHNMIMYAKHVTLLSYTSKNPDANLFPSTACVTSLRLSDRNQFLVEKADRLFLQEAEANEKFKREAKQRRDANRKKMAERAIQQSHKVVRVQRPVMLYYNLLILLVTAKGSRVVTTIFSRPPSQRSDEGRSAMLTRGGREIPWACCG